MNYFSFLIVQHPDKADLYVNGLPIGFVKDDKFERHHYVLPDGTRTPIECPKVPGLFKTAGELREHLHQLVDQISL